MKRILNPLLRRGFFLLSTHFSTHSTTKKPCFRRVFGYQMVQPTGLAPSGPPCNEICHPRHIYLSPLSIGLLRFQAQFPILHTNKKNLRFHGNFLIVHGATDWT